jgi:hypothetical protein
LKLFQEWGEEGEWGRVNLNMTYLINFKNFVNDSVPPPSTTIKEKTKFEG